MSTPSFDNIMAANSPASVVPRVGKNGVALSEKDRLKLAKKKGVCLTCGVKTHKVSLLKRAPLTTDTVHKGVCIRCDPNEVPHGVLVAYQERKNNNNPNSSGSMNNSSNSMSLPTTPKDGPVQVPFQSQPKRVSSGSSSSHPSSSREGAVARRNIPPTTTTLQETPVAKPAPPPPAQALPQEFVPVVEEDIGVPVEVETPKAERIEATTTPPLQLKINDSTTATDFTVTLSNPSATTTVQQLKEQVQTAKGIPVAQQELCLAYETLLVNHETLGHYNLLVPNDNLQIDVFYPPNYPCTQLLIDQFGDTHPATVNPCDTLEQGILQTIRTSPWFADQLRYMNPKEVERILLQLSWKGQDLTDTNKSLAELEIPNDSILHLEVSQKDDTESNSSMNHASATSMTENDKTVAAQRQQEQAFGEASKRETPPDAAAFQRKAAPVPPSEDPLVVAARLQQETLEKAPTQRKKTLPPADLDPSDPLALAALLQEQAFKATKIQQARQERVNKKLGLSKVAGAGGTATERLSRARNYQDKLPEAKPPPAAAAATAPKPASNNGNGDDYEAPVAYESKEIRMARAKAWQQVAGTKLEQEEATERERQARARLENQSKPAARSGGGGDDDGDNYEAPITYESKEVRMARAKAWQQVAGTKMEQEEAAERERQALARLQGKQPPSKPKDGDGDNK